MKAEVKLSGADVVGMLQKLPPEIVSKRGGPVLRALRKGAKVIERAEKQHLESQLEDESTGLLMKNIVVSRGEAPSGGKGERVLVRIRRKAYPDRNGHTVTTLQSAQLKEYGSSKQAPQSFIRRAFTEKAAEAITTTEKALLADIDRISKKLLKAK
jgi:HK97 gp10 family phage protein